MKVLDGESSMIAWLQNSSNEDTSRLLKGLTEREKKGETTCSNTVVLGSIMLTALSFSTCRLHADCMLRCVRYHGPIPSAVFAVGQQSSEAFRAWKERNTATITRAQVTRTRMQMMIMTRGLSVAAGGPEALSGHLNQF